MKNKFCDLLKLELEISSGILSPAKELWAGAGYCLSTDKEQSSDRWGSQPKVIAHEEAFLISAVLTKLTKIITYDYLDKYELFETLLEGLPSTGAPIAILKRAQQVYWQRSNTKPYFAYGSNMDKDQMKTRCPKAVKIANGTLEKYKFILNSRGVATLTNDEDNYVEGVLWEITADCEKALDKYEGVTYNFYRKSTCVIGNLDQVLIYLAQDNKKSPESRSGYFDKIKSAAHREGLSLAYSKKLDEYE